MNFSFAPGAAKFENQLMPRMRLLAALLVIAACANAQQPFLTDDAEVADLHRFHMELFTEHDVLQASAYPSLQQNTTRLQVTFGLLDRLEIGFDAPLIIIYNDHQVGAANAFGVGDLDLQMKYKIRSEREGSRWPAVTVGLFVELPTGQTSNQLGSGIADYWLNGITQKQLSPKLTWRINSGILFSGNTLTGAIGIRAVRGIVITASSSLSYQLTPKWLVGADLAGAITNQFDLGKSQMQGLLGSKYQLTKSLGLDFAITSGRYEGSPRVGGAIGISVDF
jgi:hypothetical protein